MRDAAPDIFAELAPLEPGLRSPCFRDAAGRLRCLPFFSIIGAAHGACRAVPASSNTEPHLLMPFNHASFLLLL